MFEATAPFLFCDYFRVPYAVTADATEPGSLGWAELRRAGSREGPVLAWPVAADESISADALRPPALVRVGSVPVYARVASEAAVRERLGAGGTWRRWLSITAAADDIASVWRDDGGNILLPFDPSEAIRNYWSEAYRAPVSGSALGRARLVSMRGYYRLRPALPRRAQIGIRRLLAKVQARARFPRWPVETALHDLYGLLFGWLAEVAGDRVPWIAAWPRGRAWALVLTHDVETLTGYNQIHVLRDVEERTGFRSSWNFVPRRYDVDTAVVDELLADGFEVGVHGLYHDGRDLESEATLRERLPEIRRYAERWRAVGFRSPATHRNWELMPLLGFEYDSSYPDTDPFEPQSGGCCSWFPFFNDDLMELPITLPQDYTLFTILRRRDADAWLDKTAAIKAAGGMALLITHPDYMLEPGLVALYEGFLRKHRGDPTLWTPLPREVSEWWRRRAQSELRRTDHGWTIVGPAANEGAIEYAGPNEAHAA